MKDINYYQKIMLGLSLASLITMFIWITLGIYFVINTTNDYNYYNNYVGSAKIFDEKTKDLSDTLEIGQKITFRAKKTSKSGAMLKTVNTITNQLSQEVLAQNEDSLNIDTKTRSYHDEKGEKWFSFPQNTQREDYDNIFYRIYPYLTVSKFTFSNEENIFGMFSYVYRYKIQDSPVDKKSIFSQNKDIKDEKILGDFDGKIWIEPRTGSVIKHEGTWTYYFIDKERKRLTIESGRIWQQDEETKRIISLIESKKAMIQIYEMWIPIYLILFSVAFAIGALIKERG